MLQLLSTMSGVWSLFGLRRSVAVLACFLMLVNATPARSGAAVPTTGVSGALPASETLPRSSPESQGISSRDILAFIQAADQQIDMMNSVIVVRHGRVVAEGWWAPYNADTPHILYSLSKSFTSTAVGLAISEGKLSLDDQVLKFFPEDAPPNPSDNLKAMRVRDLLRMVCGNQTEAQLWRPATKDEPWTRIFLAHPVPFKPGTHFLYNSPGTYMLSAIVQKVTGMTVLDYLRPRLFDPLGIKNPTWVTSPQGISAGAYGLMLRTDEIARFGQLYLQKGMWKGRQLIPKAWVAEATARQTSNGSAPTSDWDQGYGYQFWRCRHNAYRGDGAFGQYCIVVPDLDAVVAITSGVRDMQAVMNLVWDKLLPAMKNKPLPENPAAVRELKAKLASLSVKLPAGQPTSPMAEKVSGKWFEFPANDQGIQAVSLDLDSESSRRSGSAEERSPALLVRTASGETRVPIGFGSWAKSRGGFSNGIDKFLSVPEKPLLGTSAAWTGNDLTIKIVAYETTFYSTLKFHFDGDRLLLDSGYNVSFGPTKLPQLVGHLSAR